MPHHCPQTRVLVTHGVHWLPMVDQVVVMKDGLVSEMGSYDELLSHNGPFAQFLKTYFLQEAQDEDVDDPEGLCGVSVCGVSVCVCVVSVCVCVCVCSKIHVCVCVCVCV